ncbi:MAG: hypothetical protein EXR95_04365 [Gemmatimonadetes bacterium]|nr:hypothetical protein [Gemmatimonadota bacterium]
MITRLLLSGLAAASFLAAPARAQQPDRPRPVLPAVRRTGEIKIDGKIDEAAWQAAPMVSGFVQAEPDERAPATQDTQVWMLIDDDAIYVAARMLEAFPDSIGRLMVRRDEHGPYFDWFGFAVDPNLDGRTAYTFRVSVANSQSDYLVTDDQFEDYAWSAVWESGATEDSLVWSMELRVPLSQIRYTPAEGARTWGVNFTRRRVASSEMSHLAFMSRRKEEGIVSKFALLQDVVVPSKVRRIEVRPYAVSSLHQGPVEPGNPFFDGSAAGLRGGADFRLGLGPSFTLDGTVNPDFGQVEADPADINLTAFETFFDERRPFFVEDAQVFDFTLSGGRNQLFYSRRIGRSPHGSGPNDADFIDVPDAATILGAAKLTGRTSRGMSVGGLAAVTQAERGEAFFGPTGELRAFDAEPRSEFAVLTARQDLRGGASQVGVIATALHRDFPGGVALAFLPTQAYNGGVRFEHQWMDRGWRLNGFLATSHVRGSPAALIAIQLASNHYFQRPDATRARVDSSATSTTGAEWRVQLDRQNTEHWTGSVWLAEVTNGFEINDLGFSNSRERLDGGFRFGYREIRPNRWFRNYNINLGTFYNFSHEALDDVLDATSWQRAYTGGNFNLGTRVTFLNFSGAGLNVGWNPDQYSRTATRGGPVMIQPGGMGLGLSYDTDRRRSIVLNTGVDFQRNSRDAGGEFAVEASLDIRPSSQLVLGIQSELSARTDRTQYVASTATLPYAATFGRRYFFGDLERKSAQLEARVDYTFTPSLSLQLYVQPLLSSGDYVAYKQLEAHASFRFRRFTEGQALNIGGAVGCSLGSICRDAAGNQHVDLDGNGITDYSFADKDFNVRSLRGNAVLRWEYRPGSTVFLVWQRQQEGSVNVGDFDFGRDVDALWGAPADNRFIVKANYWLGL